MSAGELGRQLQAKAKTGSVIQAEISDIVCWEEKRGQAFTDEESKKLNELLDAKYIPEKDVVGVVEAWQQHRNQQLQELIKFVDNYAYDLRVHFKQADYIKGKRDAFLEVEKKIKVLFGEGSGETQQ